MSPLFACRLSLPQRTLLAAAAVAACTTGLPAVAQTMPTAQAPLTATPGAVTTIVITGNPLGRDAATSPVSVLAGDGLTLRRAGTLGETLDGLPGVASTWFGPNASRPVIRGLDGDRIRLLDNGGSTLDASSLSFDHAVAIDPLAVERIEVLRGPAALLYGGNATGGVVNSIDNRIPRAAITGVGGRAEVRVGGGRRWPDRPARGAGPRPRCRGRADDRVRDGPGRGRGDAPGRLRLPGEAVRARRGASLVVERALERRRLAPSRPRDLRRALERHPPDRQPGRRAARR